MILYLAGPMRNYPSFNFPAFDKAAATARSLGHEVFSPAERDRTEAGFDGEGYLGNEDLAGLGFSLREALAEDLGFIALEAEGVLVLPAWYNSAGATAEVATAKALGLPVYMLVFDSNDAPSLKDISHTAYRLVGR